MLHFPFRPTVVTIHFVAEKERRPIVKFYAQRTIFGKRKPSEIYNNLEVKRGLECINLVNFIARVGG